MNNIEGKFLPIGTVVLLKGATKKLMITGFCSMDVEKPDEMFDYTGCLYPEGLINSKQTALFNHDQIQQIFFIGYHNEEEVEFKNKLNNLLAVNSTVNTVANATQGTQNNGVNIQPNTGGFTVAQPNQNM